MTEPTRPGRRKRRHPASTARVLVAGMSASATLLLTAAFAARVQGPAPGASRAPGPATGATAPATSVDGWDRSGATPSLGGGGYTVAPPDTQTQAS